MARVDECLCALSPVAHKLSSSAARARVLVDYLVDDTSLVFRIFSFFFSSSFFFPLFFFFFFEFFSPFHHTTGGGVYSCLQYEYSTCTCSAVIKYRYVSGPGSTVRSQYVSFPFRVESTLCWINICQFSIYYPRYGKCPDKVYFRGTTWLGRFLSKNNGLICERPRRRGTNTTARENTFTSAVNQYAKSE